MSKRNCAVPLCTKVGYRIEGNHGKVTFHKFPKDVDLNKQWLVKIKRDEGDTFKVTEHTTVCSLHFKEEDYEIHRFSGRRTLVYGAVPTIFDCWKGLLLYKPVKERRTSRIEILRDQSTPTSTSVVDMHAHENMECEQSLDTHTESSSFPLLNESALTNVISDSDSLLEKLLAQIADLQSEVTSLDRQLKTVTEENVKLKAYIKTSEFSIDNISEGDVTFYTGFPNINVFNSLLEFVNPGPNGENLILCRSKSSSSESGVKIGRPRKLSPRNQFFLFLCRVRLGLFECDLSYRFSVSISVVSNIIISWANFLYLRLGSINLWPSKETVLKTMPESFKTKYPNTRIIIDCTEIKIEMASSLVLKSQSFSNYKSSNTLKALVGITPSGALCFTSELYTGSISDREITERSGLLLQSFEVGDGLMADKGFEIQDLLDPIGVKLNIPPFLGRQGQMSEEDVTRTQEIAAERIHVERAINKLKNFHIFEGVIPLSLAGNVNQLWSVCATLTLFQTPIISTDRTT